jgi:hypothetical protein
MREIEILKAIRAILCYRVPLMFAGAELLPGLHFVAVGVCF